MSAPERVAPQAVEQVLADVELGTRVYRVPPGQLVVGLNARSEVPDDPEFAASIREHGVLQAITAYVDDDRLVVEMGQRRTVVAAAQGLAWVPVVLVAPPDEVRRLVEQVTENEHRAPLTTADRAAAVQQLALLGLTAEQLLARTRLRRADVDHALAVAASSVASAAAAAHPITLEQAAAIAEFDDAPDVVDKLTEAAEQGGFDHVVEQAREQRDDHAAQARIVDELTAAGVRVLDSWPAYSDGARTLDELRRIPAKHARCPGHAGMPYRDGHYVDGRWETEWYARYFCTDAVAHGHIKASPEARPASLSDEQARLDRAQVIGRNAAWRRATIVRRRWLGEFARGKTAPEGAERWIVATLLGGEASRFSAEVDGVLERALYDRHRLLRDLLRRPDEQPAAETDAEHASTRQGDLDALHAAIEGGSARKALRLTCALLLAAWEAHADVHVWRRPTALDRHYLGQMITWGYEPAAVEQLVMQLDLTDTGAAP